MKMFKIYLEIIFGYLVIGIIMVGSIAAIIGLALILFDGDREINMNNSRK